MTTTTLAYIPSPSDGVLGHVGPLSALVLLIGIIAALIVGDWFLEARGRERGVIYDVALWAVPFGLIGVTLVLAYIASPVQRVWRVGPLPIRWYAIWIVIGIIVALIIGDRRWAARGGERGVIYDIALWAVPLGLIGGRLYHVITDSSKYFGADGLGPLATLRIWDGGLGIWGAVALGGVGAWIGCRQHGIPLPAFGDAIAPGIVLAQAIGRLGNYFNQELYGRPTTLPWGLEIYERRDVSGALDSLNGVSTGQLVEVVHPTFLYELLWNLLVFAALIWIDRRFKIGHGRLFAMYVAGYCVGRFWIELMRSDVATHIAGIRVNSFTSTFVFIGAVVYIMVAPKGREDPASLAGKPEKVEEEEDEVEEFAKQLTAVAATTGVVAAAKAAGDAEDEDAKAAADDEPEEPEAEDEAEEAEAAVEAEDFAPDVASAPADDEPEAEEPEAEEPEAEAEPEEPQVETEEAEEPEAEDLEAEPEAEDEAAEADDEPEAEDAEAAVDEAQDEAEEPAAEPQAEGEAAEAEEPQAEAASDDVAADDDEPEAEDAKAAVDEAQDEAEEPAAEPETEAEAEEPQAEAASDDVAEADDEPEAEDAEAAVDKAAETEPSDDAAAEESDAAEAAVAADEAEPSSDEADLAEAEQPEPEAEDEPETEDAEAAVEEAEAEPSEEEAAEEEEAVVEEADSAAEEEPTTGVLEEAEVEATAVEPEPAEESGGRLSRWLRRNR